MKKLFYILLSIGLVLGCTRDELEERVDREESEPAGKVLVQFNVSLPELTPQTKALGDTPAGDLDKIYLAVFGRSGYLKEYVETSLTPTPASTNGNIGENTNRYTITAILTLSENSERHIHFIGNGPDHLDYGQENEIIPSLLSPEGKGGYWQYMVLPGIKGARDEDDNFLTVTGGDGNTYYKPHAETAAYFQDVPLIRNFAKVVVEDLTGCNFTTRSFTVVNVPVQGTMAPYYSEGFVKDYQLKGYLDLQNAGYPGLLPLNTTFNENVPSASAFTSPDGSTVVEAGNSFFLYERPVPNDQQKPTTVIIYGHFTDPDSSDGDESGDYYYKVDLMDDQGYYPIYRNFKYRIQIEKILRPGADSPEDALRSMGSGDISADVATQNLTEISDGTSEILVSYMSRTIIRKYPYTEGNVTEQLTLLYKYIPDVNADSNNDGEADWNNNYITSGTPTEASPVLITLQDGVAEPIISSFTVDTSDDENGFRKITITTTDPNDHLRTQYLRVSGTHTSQGKKTTLFRNVTYSMISRQPLWVACVPKRVQRNQGESVEVDITIPKNLPSSMFPLVFYLESDKMSITPDNSYSNNNLPVNSGPSITGSGESTFHFVRTVSETEYNELSAASATQNVTIPCYFKTNMASSACTVYVKDEVGYFEANSDDFGNYGMKSFTDLAFPSGVPPTAETAFPFSFKMDRTDVLPDKVYLKFAGSARPLAEAYSGLTLINNASDPHYGWYWYSPATTTNTYLMSGNSYEPTVRLATTGTSGRAEVWIEADEYEPAHLRYPFVPATGLTLSPTSVTLSPNGGKYKQTEQLTATLTPSNATDELTWTSSNTSVATVDANGLVTAVARGTATITATDENGHSRTCSVTVKERTWHAASYTVDLNTKAAYDNNKNGSFTTSPQNVVFTNSSANRDRNSGPWWRTMGARDNRHWDWDTYSFVYDYSSGYYTVTAPAESEDNCIESRIVGVSQTYNDNYNRRAVSVSYAGGSTTLTEGKDRWGTTDTNFTSETTGYNQVVVTHSCTSENEYDDRNRVASVTVYYGYYSYE